MIENPFFNTGNTEVPEALAMYLDALAGDPQLVAIRECGLGMLAPIAGENILEIGCGLGDVAAVLAGCVKPGGKVTGTDLCMPLIDEAVKRHSKQPGVTFVEADAHELPFEGCSFDGAWAERVLMHVEDPLKVLAGISRVLRPGGRFIAMEPDWGTVALDHPDVEATELILGTWKKFIKNSWMGRQLPWLCKAASFEVEKAVVRSINWTELARADKAFKFEMLAMVSVSMGVPQETCDRWLDVLKDNAAKGRFFAFGNICLIKAVKPARSRG